MEIKKLYKQKTLTKTNIEIPVTINDRTIESKYNPQREAENLLNSITEKYDFFLLLGIGSGLFLNSLIEKFPDSKIIAVENTNDDITFLETNFPLLKKLKNNPSIIISDIKSLKNTLLNFYIPSIYGNLKIIEILQWSNENKELSSFIKNEINDAIKDISADFSVQSHFGKIWQNNILNNLKHLNGNIKISSNKTECAVIAAGPSLDNKLSYLQNNKENLFIISTDTSYSTLLKHDIVPEIVVSLDGQFISHTHFMHNNPKNTIFAFDLCSNNSAINHIPQNQILFFVSGHPLSSLCNDFLNNSLLQLNSGSGTVTIAAFDMALKLGFNEIELFGADFSYRKGKTYTKGTYLETLYSILQNKLKTNEYLFSNLQYRTELISISDLEKTTPVLQSYKTSFENFLIQTNCDFKYEDEIYFIKNNSQNKAKVYSFSYKTNISSFFDYAEKQFNLNNISFLLPYISYLRNKKPSESFIQLLKLAHSSFVRYNYKYEKK